MEFTIGEFLPYSIDRLLWRVPLLALLLLILAAAATGRWLNPGATRVFRLLRGTISMHFRGRLLDVCIKENDEG